jgi:hypothetical protein
MTALAAAAARRVDGRLVLAALLGLFVGALWLQDGYWPRFGVPGARGLEFIDLRYWTTAWDCVRAGIEIDPANPCDDQHRLIDHPRIWLAPAVLGLGEGSTIALGLCVAAVFLVCVFAVIGRFSTWDAVVYAAVLCSPSVLLGIERANTDLIVFSTVAAGLLLLRSRHPVAVAGAHWFLLLASFLKLYPVLSWGVLLRRPLRSALIGLTALTVAFAAYLFAIQDHLREIRSTLPRQLQFSYGASVLADGSGVESLEDVTGQLLVVALGLVAAAALAAVVLRRRRNGEGRLAAPDPRSAEDLDAFWAGAGVYVGSFALAYNFNYRLIFLVLTVPQLLRWARERRPLVPYAPVGLSLLLLALWLGASLSFYPLGLGDRWEHLADGFQYDELVNLALFAYLAAALVVTVPAKLATQGGSGAYANVS